MVRLPRNEKQTYWLNSRPQMWPMVWIYQIVTGVTSVVGVPSTHLVLKCGPKSGLSCRRQVVHPRPQTPQGESVAKPETPLLIMLSIACKHEVHGNFFSPLFEREVRGQKHPREMVINRNSMPNISQYITSKGCQHRYRTTSAPEGQATTGHPFPNQQTHNYMLCPISRIQLHISIYTLVQTIISVQAKLEVLRRKHIVHPTGFGAYSSSCCKGTNNCVGTMGVDQLPSSTVGL